MLRRITLVTAIATLASTLPAWAQEASPAQWEAWADAFFAAERAGPKFGHAWIRKAQALRQARLQAAEGPNPPPGVYSLRGVFKMPVLAGAYADVTPKYSEDQYQEAFFGAGGSRYTLSQFFSEASGGDFTFEGSVEPWIALDSTRSYYVDGDLRGRYQQFMYDVLVRAEATVDWREYDNDGPDGVPDSGDDDGFVDMVAFMHPLADGVCRSDALGGPVATGFRLEYVGGPFSRVPYSTSTLGAAGQPLKVDDFILSAGLDCDGSSIAAMNINIHEMGHALGLPDLNDLDRSSFGVGVWDVMGYGIWAAAGRPTQFGAWSRRQVGWAVVEAIESTTTVSLEPAIGARRALRFDIPGTHQYFLLENRQRLFADAGLPGTGLVVWRVDDDVLLPAVQNYRGTENEQHPGLAVLQADGRNDLAANVNRGDAGDPFPGSSGKTSITDGTEVNLRGYGGESSGVYILDIQESGDNVTFRIVTDSVAPLVAQDQSLRPATLGERGYADTLRADGGRLPLVWAATSALPDGLELFADGTVEGDPVSMAPSSFGFTVTDQDGVQVAGTATLQVVMPTFTESAMVQAVLGGPPLGAAAARALDLLGNGNGRLDIGDVLLYRSREP